MDYPSNSRKSREETVEREKKEKIVKGKVTTKKKSELNKIADSFISEDVANVKSYILKDVLLPAAKKALSDIVTNGVDMLLYGETGVSKKKSHNVSYTSYSSNKRNDYRHTRRDDYDFDDIIFESRTEANDVLITMEETLDRFNRVTVLDFYDFVGITGRFTDDRYGWFDLATARVVPCRGGYKIKLPRVREV